MWDLIVSVPDHCLSFLLCICKLASNRLFDKGGVLITTTNACIFCRTDFVANIMTTEKSDLGLQTRICSNKPGKYISSVFKCVRYHVKC